MKFLVLICTTSLLFLISCHNGSQNKNANSDSIVIANKQVPLTPIKYDSSKKYIFLTWDDSPQPPGTINCRNVFKQQNIKATFFSVGFNQVGPLKKRIIDSIRNEYPQFLLANHSFTHGFNNNYGKFYSMPDSAYNDFMKNEKILDINVKIIRLPGNNTWASNGKIHGQKADNPLIKKLDAAGYKIVGWDMEWSQKGGQKAPKESATEMANLVNKKLADGSTEEQNTIVILSHDRLFEKQEYLDSLSKFISILKQDSHNVFETIDHYPSVQKK